MGRYRLKPTEVEAVQWSGSNWHQMLEFAGREQVWTTGGRLFVRTPDGDKEAHPDDWVVRNDDDDFRVWVDSEFRLTFEEGES